MLQGMISVFGGQNLSQIRYIDRNRHRA